MEDFNKIYQKAGVLMQSALKKYAKGDYEGGDKDREEANRLYELAQSMVNMVSGNIYMNESRNTGVINMVLENNTANLCEDKTKRRQFKNILNIIKENKNFRQEFKFYDALINPVNVADAELYVNEAIGVKPIIDPQKTKDTKDKVINEMMKNNFFEFVDIDDDTMKLFESIEYVLFNNPNLKNLAEYTNAKHCIIEHVTNKMNNEEETQKETESIDEALNKLVEKYDTVLNNDEKKLIKTISEAKDKEQIFNNYKEDVLKKIDEVTLAMNKNEAKELDEVREDISSKAYNSSKLLEDISEFIEIKNVLSEKN